MTTTLAAPTATAYTDPSPCPRVSVVIAVVAGVASVTVYRSSSAGKDAIRDAVRKPVTAVGSMVFNDFEAPFGTPLTYTVVAYDAAGVPSVESAASAAVTLNVTTGCPWAIDPTNPSLSMQWKQLAWDSREYKRDQAQLIPLASDQAIVVTGRRSLPFSTTEVVTQTAEDAATLRSLADTPVIQLRTPTTWVWRGGYFTIGGCTESPHYFDPTDPTMVWQLELIPATRPDPALFFPVYTWADVIAMYPTWAGVAAAKNSWLSVEANPDPGSGT